MVLDGWARVAGPQPDHHDCYREEPKPGDDAEDDITGEHGYCHAEGECDAGEHRYQQPVARKVGCCHCRLPACCGAGCVVQRLGGMGVCRGWTSCGVTPGVFQAERRPAVQDGVGVEPPGKLHQPDDGGQAQGEGEHRLPSKPPARRP